MLSEKEKEALREKVREYRTEIGEMNPGDTTFHAFWTERLTAVIEAERKRCANVVRALDLVFADGIREQIATAIEGGPDA